MKTILPGLFCLSVFLVNAQALDSAGFYKQAVTIHAGNADSIKTFSNTPEAVTLYYFASRIRKDSLWKNVLPAEAGRGSRLSSQLEGSKDWKYLSIKLVRKMIYSENRVFVKAMMEFDIKGNRQSGKDDFEVTLTDGKWLITGAK